MESFRGRTADEVWRLAYTAVMASANRQVQASRAGATVELLHAVLEIADPRHHWVTSRFPALNPAFGIAEVIWILAGSNDAEVLNYWFPRLTEFAGEGPTYAGAYGHRLRHHFGVDQVKRACEVLASNPMSRQVVLQYWDARSDLPQDNGAPRCQDIPCNVMSLLKVRDNRLEWTQVMRSNDLHRGLPHNILQFTVLQEIIAGWLQVEVGSYHHWSDSLHIYVADMERFSCTLPPEPPLAPGDSLATDAVRGEALIAELYCRMVELTKPGLTEQQLANLDAFADAPFGYQNLLHVLAAESARRRGRHDQANALMERCTNPQLLHVWSSWKERVWGAPIGRSTVPETVTRLAK